MNTMQRSEVDKFESDFWGNCANTYGEERKQIVYARKMGLRFLGDWRSDYNIDMVGKAVMDIGGGPVSLLLKCVNLKYGCVIDPLRFPDWVYARYSCANLYIDKLKGEDLIGVIKPQSMDEAWIYNVLQHCDDPGKIIASARYVARCVRLFEWIDIPAYPGHPHMLTEQMLKDALGGAGQTEWLNEDGCVGRCFYGAWYA